MIEKLIKQKNFNEIEVDFSEKPTVEEKKAYKEVLDNDIHNEVGIIKDIYVVNIKVSNTDVIAPDEEDDPIDEVNKVRFLLVLLKILHNFVGNVANMSIVDFRL